MRSTRTGTKVPLWLIGVCGVTGFGVRCQKHHARKTSCGVQICKIFCEAESQQQTACVPYTRMRADPTKRSYIVRAGGNFYEFIVHTCGDDDVWGASTHLKKGGETNTTKE
jgi:hypothetical protein